LTQFRFISWGWGALFFTKSTPPPITFLASGPPVKTFSTACLRLLGVPYHLLRTDWDCFSIRWTVNLSVSGMIRAVRNHEFTIAVITVIFAVYRDFWPLPWFRVTAVNIGVLYAISVFKRSLMSRFRSTFPFRSCTGYTYGHLINFAYLHAAGKRKWRHYNRNNVFIENSICFDLSLLFLDLSRPSEKLTRMSNRWHTGLQIKNVSHISLTSLYITCLFLLIPSMLSAV